MDLEPGREPYRYGEDSRLLAGYIERSLDGGRLGLDIGTGLGTQLSALAKKCGFVVGTDLDRESLRQALQALKEEGLPSHAYDLVLCDRASPLRDGVFDFVVFNPPYLPDQPGLVDETVDGGPTGGEVPSLFLEEALRVARAGGRIYFVLSSLTGMEGLRRVLQRHGGSITPKSTGHYMFERLTVYECSRPGGEIQADP